MQPSQRYRALKSHCHALTAFPAQRKKKEREIFPSEHKRLPFGVISQSIVWNEPVPCQVVRFQTRGFTPFLCQKRKCTSWKTGSGFLEMRAENAIQSYRLDMETVVLDS